MNDWFYIEDQEIDNFLQRVREISFEKFIEINDSFQDKEDYLLKLEKPKNIDSIITIEETKNIAMTMIKKYKSGYKFSKKTLYKIIENLNSRMISNSLVNLVSSGALESAFDEELNDFVFWIK